MTGPASDFPFRVEPRTADDETLARLNREQGRTRARAFEPAAKAIQRARTQKRFTHDRMEALVHHPDERVRRATIFRAKDDLRAFSSQERHLLKDPGYEAVREAERDGLLWSPVLDAVAGSRLQHAQTGTLLAQAREWIQAQTDPRKLEPLFTFSSYPFGEQLALHTRCADEALVRAAAESLQSVNLAKFATLPCTAPYVHVIEEWAVRAWAESTRKHDVVHVLDRLERAKRPVQPATYEHLVHTGEPYPWLVELQGLSSDQLLRLHQRCVEAGAAVPMTDTQAARHPSATKEVWLSILNNPSGNWTGLAGANADFWLGDDRRRLDPDLRRAFLQHSLLPRSYSALIEDGLPDAPEILQRFFQSHPMQAMELLEGSPELQAQLTPADLAPLVQSSNSEYRQRAILVLGKLRRPTPAPDTPSIGPV